VENLEMNAEFWQGRRVFLTGHTGFKGSWLALMLQTLGADVHGYALAPSTTPSLFVDADVATGMHSTIGDIRDTAQLTAALCKAKPEVVLHLAAQAIVSEAFDQPLATLATNVIGTANLLEAVRGQTDVRSAIIVTSDKCYENKERQPAYREHEPLGGRDPYSASKACAELVTASWRHSFFDKPGQAVIATARAGNVIGGGDWSRDRLVPDMIRAFQDKEPALLRSPDSIRPWQHVLEPLCGYLLLAERCAQDRSFGQAWNFGPDEHDARPVRFLADTLVQLWGNGASWHQHERNPLKEAGILKLDSSKARTLLQWQPVTDLTRGLQLTASWYENHAAGGNARELTVQQIRSHLHRS
jgi:CDP-glucose 4,6-dehydratase